MEIRITAELHRPAEAVEAVGTVEENPANTNEERTNILWKTKTSGANITQSRKWL